MASWLGVIQTAILPSATLLSASFNLILCLAGRFLGPAVPAQNQHSAAIDNRTQCAGRQWGSSPLTMQTLSVRLPHSRSHTGTPLSWGGLGARCVGPWATRETVTAEPWGHLTLHHSSHDRYKSSAFYNGTISWYLFMIETDISSYTHEPINFTLGLSRSCIHHQILSISVTI